MKITVNLLFAVSTNVCYLTVDAKHSDYVKWLLTNDITGFEKFGFVGCQDVFNYSNYIFRSEPMTKATAFDLIKLLTMNFEVKFM